MNPDPSAWVAQVQGFYLDEMNDHLTYRALAQDTRDHRLRGILERIAAMERGHAGFWEAMLQRLDAVVPAPRPRRLRLALLRLLQRLVSPLWLVAALELGERGALHAYHQVWRTGPLSPGERERLRRIILDEMEHEATFREQSEGAGLRNLRDFILGMNDGLVELLGAVTGLSAAYPGRPLWVGASGLVVGLAGALSMGIGAYVSVRSQRQVNEGRRTRMDIAFDVAPERAVQEYRSRLAASGLPDGLAGELAGRLGERPDALRRLLLEPVRDSEWRAAWFTGGAYLFGVVFPVAPYFISADSGTALFGSVALAGAVLGLVGVAVALLSGISLRAKALELTVSGLGAAALAYGFGMLVQRVFGIAL